MLGYLLDTNILSELVKQKRDESVTAFVREQNDLWISVITLHELGYGIARLPKGARQAELAAWMDGIIRDFEKRILDTTLNIAQEAGTMRAKQDAQGRNCDPLDALIAATALTHSLTLVTRNVKDFIPFGIPILNPFE